jgi:hypothetical protein
MLGMMLTMMLTMMLAMSFVTTMGYNRITYGRIIKIQQE